jgi:hypothetical protein
MSAPIFAGSQAGPAGASVVERRAARTLPSNVQEDSAMPEEIVIVGAARTAVGSFNGVFITTPAQRTGL